MSEATLWNLYRRLLAGHRLEQRLAPSLRLKRNSGIAAALTENLLAGDTLGLSPNDLVTRYLSGVPLAQLRAAAHPRRGRRKQSSWAHPSDPQHGLLPGAGDEQASFALGAALAARLNPTSAITVLCESTLNSAPTIWQQAAATAVSLQLPLLFISAHPSSPGPQPGPKKPAPTLPSIPVDRDDALALYRVIYESAARARSGGGPTWIECLPWPLPHTPLPTANALSKMEETLRARKLFDRHRQRQIETALEKEFAQADWPLPPPLPAQLPAQQTGRS